MYVVSLEIGSDTTPEGLEVQWVAYWTYVIRVTHAVAGWKRRLGGDATSAELAADKRTARQLMHHAVQHWGWAVTDEFRASLAGAELPADATLVLPEAAGGVGEALTDEERSDAATVRWKAWADMQLERLEALLPELEAYFAQHGDKKGLFKWRRRIENHREFIWRVFELRTEGWEPRA